MNRAVALFLCLISLMPLHTACFSRLRNFLLNFRQQILVQQLQRQRLAQRCLSSCTSHKLQSIRESYSQLKQDANSKETKEMLEATPQYTKQTLLIMATEDANIRPQAVSSLLEAGAKINQPNGYGMTPLHFLAAKVSRLYHSNHEYFDEIYYRCLLAHIAHFNPNFDVKDNIDLRPADYAPEELKKEFEYHEPIPHSRLREMYPGY